MFDSLKVKVLFTTCFFNFGHHALPYEVTAKNASKDECAGCHIAGAGKTDLTWVDFYPVLRGKN